MWDWRVGRTVFPLKLLGKNLSHALLLTSAVATIPGCLWLVGTTLQSLWLHCHSSSPVSPCLFLEGHSRVGLRAHRTPAWPHWNQWHLQWPYFQITSHSEVLRRTSVWGGNSLQPRTPCNCHLLWAKDEHALAVSSRVWDPSLWSTKFPSAVGSISRVSHFCSIGLSVQAPIPQYCSYRAFLACCNILILDVL